MSKCPQSKGGIHFMCLNCQNMTIIWQPHADFGVYHIKTGGRLHVCFVLVGVTLNTAYHF